jgi:enediyne biosynthesis protein E4
MITRRELMFRMASAASASLLVPSVFGQGISSRGLKPQPRGKPSGRPFLARFTDVAKQAGLIEPIVYGGVDSKNYIVEVVGAGVAFIDYDNDSWMAPNLKATRRGFPIGSTKTIEMAHSPTLRRNQD